MVPKVLALEHKIRFLADSPYAQDICGHSGKQSPLYRAVKVSDTECMIRETIKSGFKGDYPGGINVKYEAALAIQCGFEVTWPEWRTGTREKFEARYNALYEDPAARAAARDKAAAFRKSLSAPEGTPRLRVSRPRRFPPADDLLASLQLGTNQPGGGQPWPLTIELVCRFAPMDRVKVGVRRGKLIVNCGHARTTSVAERLGGGPDPHKPDGSTVTIIASGDDIQPVWLIESETGAIGVVIIPDGICQLLDLAPGHVICAQFQAYIKDLRSQDPGFSNTSAAKDAASPEVPQDDSYSFALADRRELETRAKNAILARMAELKLLGEGDWVVLCRDELNFEEAADVASKS